MAADVSLPGRYSLSSRVAAQAALPRPDRGSELRISFGGDTPPLQLTPSQSSPSFRRNYQPTPWREEQE